MIRGLYSSVVQGQIGTEPCTVGPGLLLAYPWTLKTEEEHLFETTLVAQAGAYTPEQQGHQTRVQFRVNVQK
jgi:hypothetical protein